MLQENQLFANRYRLVKRLGQGAFSEVWKAEDTKVGNLIVALKVYAPDKGLDEDGAKVFGDEFAIVFNIHHQNLLTPSTFDEEKGSPYLVLPYCERGSALRLIGKMDEKEVARFLHDVSSALVFLHQKEIVHQDIKPDNVLIDSDGNYLLTDFGISTRMRSTLRRSVGDKKSSGTRAYMGPERFGRMPSPIKASDIWSLGATVYELMVSDVPFGEDGGLVQMMGALTPEVMGSYSAELKQLVELCLSKETWDRPTAEQIRDICDGYLRTGVWDLSSLNKSGTQEPEKPRKAAGRPTERKVRQEFHDDSVIRAKDEPAKNKGSEPKMNKKRWIILLSVIVGITVVSFTTLTIIKQSKNKAIANVSSQTYTVNGVSFKMINVEGGTFQMGSNDGDEDEKPIHSVTLSDFWIGETEVTQELWKAVMGSNPSSIKGDNRPVETVNPDDCQEFIQKLNKLTGETFCLPTEAEWEFAARGGNLSKNYMYAGSNTPRKVGWFSNNSWHKTHPVKKKLPNELGLYDMSGNVNEWCSDYYGSKYYRVSPSVNPQGRDVGDNIVMRGGSWYYGDVTGRVSSRHSHFCDSRFSHIGLRLAISNHRDVSSNQNADRTTLQRPNNNIKIRCFRLSK